jgi:molybdenum cofactor cytidylyltransferase
MGSPKAALITADGRPFIVAIVESLTSSATVDEIIIVSGIHHDAIVTALGAARPSVRVVRNHDPERGQLSSVWTGMDAIGNADAEALLMTLVDVPNINPATVQAVVAAWRATGAPIVRPAIGERHGHPVLFDRRVFDELRGAPLDQGAKAVVRAHAGELLNVPVTDTGCLVDIDTPEEYRLLRRT